MVCLLSIFFLLIFLITSRSDRARFLIFAILVQLGVLWFLVLHHLGLIVRMLIPQLCLKLYSHPVRCTKVAYQGNFVDER